MRRYEMVPRRSNPSSAELAARIREMNLGDKAGRAARRTYEFGREYLPKAGRVLYSAAKTGAKYGGMTLAAVGKYGGRAAEFVGSGVESWGRKRNPSSRRKTSPMSEHRFHVYSSSSRIPVYTSNSLKDARGTFVAGKQAALSSMKMGDYGSPAYGEVFALTRDGAIVETSAPKTSFEAAFGIVGQPIEAFFEYYDVPSSKRKRNPSSRLEPVLVPRAVYSRRMR